MTHLRALPVALLLGATAAPTLPAQDDSGDGIRWARFPHSCGDQLAFTYHGDIWVSGLDGSGPRRLTAHIANDRTPRFSPDGRWIAFTSDRMGNDDVWVVSSTGGEPRQLTFHSTSDRVAYWTPDGQQVLFSTSRGSDPWGTPLHTVDLKGSLPRPMAMDWGAAGMISQDGRSIAFNRSGTRYWRKGYRGNRNTDVWVQAVAGGPITQLTDTDTRQYRDHPNDSYPMWGADGRIYYLSERSGTYEIWRIDADGTDAEQVTQHGGDGVQFPGMSPDGRTLTYESGFRLWRMDVTTGNAAEIVVRLDHDPKINHVDYIRVSSEADGMSPSPDGSYVAVDRRGEIFIVPTDAKFGEMTQVTRSAWRDRDPSWSPDGKHIAYISDESGAEQYWLYTLESGSRRMLTDHDSAKYGTAIWASDSDQFAFTAANRLFVVNVAGDDSNVRELAYNPEGGYSLSGYSKDGTWLVYSRRDSDLDSEVYLFEIASGRELNVTDDPHYDGGGVLTPDGAHLVFTSDRSASTQIYRLSLTAQTEDPEDPLVREQKRLAKKKRGKTAERVTKTEKPGGDEESAEDSKEGSTAPLAIDLDDIRRRPVALTSGEGASGAMLSKDGTTVYFQGSDDDGPGLFSIPLEGGKQKRVAKGRLRDLSLTHDGKTLFHRSGSAVMRMPIGSKAEKVTFEFPIRVDRRAEWRQIFEESYLVMKHRFYDAKMHGVDWPAMRAKYLPILDACGSTEDVYDLCNEMIGELNASHTGVRGPRDIDQPDTYRTRLFGLELQPDGERLRVAHVYRDGPADKEWLDVTIGDTVSAIDGQPVTATSNYWRILNHALNEYVPIQVVDAETDETRELRIKTVTSLRNVQYEEWVEQRREIVERVGGGNVAYVHIRSMNRSSLARFEREINRFWNARSIIVDIRNNGGGNIDQQLIDILERRPYEYWNSRWRGASSGRRPRQAIAGPKVMLINARSGSDSEVTPQGFRDLELGRIVGTPTAAAVIATGSHRLINGATIRTPGSLVVTYDPTKPNNFGINLENYGVPPDVWIENTPADLLQGHDRELETAVKEALRMLGEGRWQYSGKAGLEEGGNDDR